MDTEKAFHAAMIGIYQDAKSLAGYNATRFLSMVSDRGGLETARMLIAGSKVSHGYTALWERGHLELTVEALILRPEWRPLFTPGEREIARGRLRDYGYTGVIPPE
jgi:hypothetical protein